ncbi:retention module-containing protein [Citrobacter freundii]|nr:retention module-containing protein [Citrobacter freundii]
MSNLLGVVKAVIGLVYVVEPDGSQRLLKEGDRIYTGEEVVTSDNGAVSLSLPDGKTVDIGRSSHWGEHGLNTVAPQHTESQDVAALQKAIADGADPTKTLEATAAGNEPPLHLEGGGGGHTLVQTELTGLIVDPNAGFNTTGIGEPGWRHDLPVGDQGDHTSSVLPPLVHIDFFAGNDNYVNRDEIHHADIKGTSNKDHVVLQFTDSQNHTLTVEVPVINGHWETQLDLSAFAEGHISVEATATDVAGRVAHSTTSAIIDVTGPQDTITVHTVAGDDVVNGTENRMATHITGDVGGDAQLGDRVVVRIQGQDYTGEVIKGSDGKLGYDISIPVGGLKEGENTVDVTVFSQDKAGNTASAHTQTTVLLDTHADAGVTINDITRDNTLNHNELSEGKQTITGNVDGDAKLHDTVHVQVNGHDYYGEVQEINGKLGYSIDVDSSAFSNNQGEIDTDVKFTVSVISTDNHGNQVVATTEHTTHIDNHADAQIRVHTVAGDNVVNGSENRMATHIQGDVGGDAREGDRVVVSVQGQEYTGEVVKGLNGHLSYDVAVPVGGLKEGLNTVGVTVYSHDDVGNQTKAHTETVVTLDTHAKAAITINDVTPDNTLNHNELTTDTQTITGHVSGDAKVHDTVHVQINGHDYYGEVIQLGKGRLGYSINVDSSAFSNNQGEIDTDVKFTVSVISTDNHGNPVIATSEHTTHIDNHADAQIRVHTVAGDNVVNGSENRMATHIQGDVGGDAREGDRVVVSVLGQEYTGEVVKGLNGHLSYDVAVPVGGLKEGLNTVGVTVYSHDDVGNETKAHTETVVRLDTHAKADVTINDVTPDNTLNHNELTTDTQTITGHVSGDAKVHDTVHVQINGHDYYGEVIQLGKGRLGYSIDVKSADFSNNQGEIDKDVKFTVSVISTDNHGNQVIATTEHTTHIDNHADAQIHVHTVAGDNVVNSAENSTATHIQGDVGGDAREGDRVVVRVQGQEYTGEVVKGLNGHLSYNVAVPVGGLKEGLNTVGVTVYSHDDVGNETKAHTETVVTLDTHAKAAITINDVTPDNTLNHNELTTDTQTITGHVSGDAKVNDKVHVQINGHDYYGEVIPLGKGRLGYSIDVKSADFSNNQGEIDTDVKFTVSVISTDNHGNQVVATTEHTTHIDNHADAQIHVHTVAGDNVVNSTENRMATHILGDVSGDAREGDRVVVRVQGQEYTGEVVKGLNGHLSYDVAVPTGGLKEGLNTVGVTVYSHDDVGNETKAHTETVVRLDTHAKAAITINDVTPDNTLNHNELTTDTQTITGHVSGDAKVHDTVHVQINGHDYYGEVIQLGKGRLGYSIDVKSADFSNNQGEIDKDVKFTVSVISTDNHGNQVIATTEHTTHIDNHADAQIRVHTVAGDNVVNSAENSTATHIQGDVGGDAREGDKVVVNVLGQEYTGEVVKGLNGHLSYDVAVPVGGLKEGLNTVGVTVYSHDDVGNETKAHTETVVTLDTHAKAAITINDVTPDNTLNHNELTTDTQTITGHVSGDAKVHDIVHVQINGHDYYGEVIPLGKGRLGYSINVDSSAFSNNQGEIDTDVKFTVSVISTDNHDNQVIATSEHTTHIDNHSNTLIHIHDVAGDNVVNGAENRMATHIQGDVGGDAREGDRVVVRVQGQEFAGEVVKGAGGQLGYDIAVPVGVLKEGHNKVEVSIYSHDDVGNTSESHSHTTVLLDTHAKAAITINDVTQDNTLNHSELAGKQAITGTVGGDAKLHDTVHVQINGHDYYGEVKEINGRLAYNIDVNASDFSNNQGKIDTDVKFTVSVISTDIHGNPTIATAEHTTHIDNHAENDATFKVVAGDDTVSRNESRMPTLIHGLVSGIDAKEGDKVLVTFGNHHYDGKVVMENGHLSYNVFIPSGDLKEGANDVHVKVFSHDDAGNEAVAEQHRTVTLDTHANATITINDVTTDNTLNRDELYQDKQIVSGTVGGDARPGDVVTLDINGHHYTGHVDSKFHYHIAVDSSAFATNDKNVDGKATIVATVTAFDSVQNEVIQSTRHDVQIDNHTEATISFNNLAGDNTINAAESDKALTTVSGTVSGDVHENDVVHLNVNGHLYEALIHVQPNGLMGYSVPVKTSDLMYDDNHQLLEHPSVEAMVIAYDTVGNAQIIPVTNNYTIDLHADATITIDPVTANHDNIINGAESQQETTTITGTVGGDAKVNDIVHLYLEDPVTGKHVELTGVVDANHRYSINVSTSDLMDNPHIRVTVTATDNADNTVTAQATQDITLDTQVDAHITIDSVTTDNRLNAFEQGRDRTLVSGTVSGEAQLHDHVQLVINNNHYDGEVIRLDNGKLGYQIMVNTRDIDANPDIHASLTHHSKDADFIDKAGNHQNVSADHHVILDDHADAGVTINIVSGDDVLNGKDQQAEFTTVNGYVSGDVKAGDIVHVMVDGVNYDAEVKPQPYLNGALGYSVEVKTADLLASEKIYAKVTGTDEAGNHLTVQTEHEISADARAKASITIDPVTGDNLIKGDEAHTDKTTITGKITGDVKVGDPVDLVINGQHYHGKVEQGDHGLTYKIDVSTADLLAEAQPEIHASVLGKDDAGNTYLATAHDNVEVGSRITVDHFQTNLQRDFYTITGHVAGTDVHTGDTVVIKLGDISYTTKVEMLPDGKPGYQFDKILGGEVKEHSQVTVEVQAHTAAGKEDYATAHVDYTKADITNNLPDLHSGSDSTGGNTQGNITIDHVAGNDVIDGAESQQLTTVVRGTVSGDVHAGDVVTLTIGSQHYTGVVIERPNLPGEYGYKIDVDTQQLLAHHDITATVAGPGGEDRHVDPAQTTVTSDLSAEATITLDPIAGDNVINIAESQSGTTTVTGTVTGDVHVGSVVTLTVNHQTLTALVYKDDKTGELRFSKEVSIDDLRQDPHLYASVTGVDDQGNTHLATDDQPVTVDTVINAGVTIDDIAHHNTLNLNDTQQQTTDITGTVSGDVHQGDFVTVVVNHHEYSGFVDEHMRFKVAVNTSDLIAGKGVYAEVTGHDDAQNALLATATKDISIDTTASASITINTVAGDDILTAAELHAKVTEVSGRVGGDARVGDTVIVTVNGHETTALVEERHGVLVYHAEVLTHDLRVDPTITARVIGQDNVGNDFSADAQPKTLTIDDHAFVQLVLNEISSDNVLNLAESKEGKTTISGEVSGDVKAGDHVTVHVNGNDLVAEIKPDGHGGFTFSVDANTVDLLQDGHVTATVKGTDPLGNTVTVTQEQNVSQDFVAKADIFTYKVTGDGYINQQEHLQDKTLVTGRVGKDARVGDTVTIEVNGKPFTTTVVEEKHHLVYKGEIPNTAFHEGVNHIVATVSVTDAAGNPATAKYESNVTVDTQINAEIKLDHVGMADTAHPGQDIINDGMANNLTLKGTLTGDVIAHNHLVEGDKVTLLVNGHPVTTYAEMINGHLGYQVAVDRNLLVEGENTVQASITVSDEAGNTKTAALDQPRVITLDSHADAHIVIDNVTGDNHLSHRELHHDQIHITGSMDGDVHDNDSVTVTIGDQDYTGQLHNVDGHLTYDIPVLADDFHLGLNPVKVTVDAHDEHGNITQQSQHVDVTVAPPEQHGPHGHHGPYDQHGQPGHHAGGAQSHALNNLFDNSHEQLSFNSLNHANHAGHHGAHAGEHMQGGTGERIDLSALYHELHHGSDITSMIAGGDEPVRGNAPQPAQHVKAEQSGAPVETHAGHGDHSMSVHSLDHLLGRPDHQY